MDDEVLQPAVRPEPDAPQTYTLNVHCHNCGARFRGTFAKGTQVEDAPCERCGCQTLVVA
jgi:hypothetical protein